MFVQINGHHLFLIGLNQLFEVVPVGGAPAPRAGRSTADGSCPPGCSGSAVKLALPVVAALLLADLGLGLLARVAPQFNLFALEMPAKMLLGLTALVVWRFPVIVPRLDGLFRTLPQHARVVGADAGRR